MKILYLDPALPQSPSGNRSTSTRLVGHWQSLGHEVDVVSVRAGQAPEADSLQKRLSDSDLLVALHAGYCQPVLELWRQLGRPVPMVFLVSGTDLFQPILESGTVSKDFAATCQDARRIITFASGLEDQFPADQKNEWAKKTRTILQGAEPVLPQSGEVAQHQAVVVSHLRRIKDPLLPLEALEVVEERLPTTGVSGPVKGMTIHHFGKLLDPGYREAVENSGTRLSRGLCQWHWLGNVTQDEIRQRMTESPLLILPSIHEGGANVIGEFLVSGLPVIASRVPGNTGILGNDWPGLFESGDAGDLATLLLRWLGEEEFRQELVMASRQRAPQHDLGQEKAQWAQLLKELECDSGGN